MRRILCFFPLVMSLFLIMFLAGCWNPFKPDQDDGGNIPPKEQLLPRTTPQNVLHNLRVIYSVMDNDIHTAEEAHSLAEQYRSLLHPDFKFYFLAADVPPDLPENWWGRDGMDGEVASFDTLQTERALGLVSEIQLSWSPQAAVPDNRLSSEPPYQLLHPGWMWIHVTSVLLEVREDPTIYQVPNGTADFYFAPDPADTTRWVIAEWFDRQPS